ncbi:hypothetical protein H0A36_29370 [Endozoicomonas sp. SM1973]|uniref:Acb2/Tad1 hairpin domain-containing protein n=1 Tax=Spartinivicinus marinus TaxID=2994442 RepID=A0A853ILB8_9GAMM|nr:hypothetical protein [Spartinivicinus marinus]NYZ70127.1 hypothetical protein [Spartinivicinus marinus]
MNKTHFIDSNGNPAGGTTSGRGFAISWQNGPLDANGERLPPNGAFVEDIINAAKDRLEFYQESKFCCDYNAEAIKHLESAINVLNSRTANREKRGVEGTHEV